eukprot:GFUD01051806.1.p1 GENE.GFUD01051806.1~~GFUD01051806.1.p1  ORF type:complete len:214 (-),score=33.38 GFUD01051806.1:24-620(-)
MANIIMRPLCRYEQIREDIINERREFYKVVFGHFPKSDNRLLKTKVPLKKKIKIPDSKAPRRSGRSHHLAKSLEVESETCLVSKKKTPKTAIEVINFEEKLGSVGGSENNQKFKCSDCNQDFAFKNSLMKHKKSKHSDVIYCCNICDKTFRIKDSVLRHKKSIHSEVKAEFLCNLCTQTFKYKRNLKAHIVKIHTNEM